MEICCVLFWLQWAWFALDCMSLGFSHICSHAPTTGHNTQCIDTQHTAHSTCTHTAHTMHKAHVRHTQHKHNTTATQHHTHTNYMPTCCSTRTWHRGTWHQRRSHYNTARLCVVISGPPSTAVTAAAVTAAAVMHFCRRHRCRRCDFRCSRTFSCAPTAAPWPGAAPQRHGEQLWPWGGAVPVAGWAAAAWRRARFPRCLPARGRTMAGCAACWAPRRPRLRSARGRGGCSRPRGEASAHQAPSD